MPCEDILCLHWERVYFSVHGEYIPFCTLCLFSYKPWQHPYMTSGSWKPKDDISQKLMILTGAQPVLFAAWQVVNSWEKVNNRTTSVTQNLANTGGVKVSRGGDISFCVRSSTASKPLRACRSVEEDSPSTPLARPLWLATKRASSFHTILINRAFLVYIQYKRPWYHNDNVFLLKTYYFTQLIGHPVDGGCFCKHYFPVHETYS